MHIRTQIRNAVKGALSGLSVGANVYASRLVPLPADKVPAIEVSADAEDLSGASLDQLVERRVEVIVAPVVKTATGWDTALDGIAAEIETALSGSTLGGLVKSLDLHSYVAQSDQADLPTARGEMCYIALCFTPAGDPGTSI